MRSRRGGGAGTRMRVARKTKDVVECETRSRNLLRTPRLPRPHVHGPVQWSMVTERFVARAVDDEIPILKLPERKGDAPEDAPLPLPIETLRAPEITPSLPLPSSPPPSSFPSPQLNTNQTAEHRHLTFYKDWTKINGLNNLL